jgi:hypothetical protein
MMFFVAILLIAFPDWADPNYFNGRTPLHFAEVCEGLPYSAQFNGVYDGNGVQVSHRIILENYVPGMTYDSNDGTATYIPITPGQVVYAYWTQRLDPNYCQGPRRYLTAYKVRPRVEVTEPVYEICCSGIPGDLNFDGIVNFRDLSILADNWLKE